MRSVSSAVAAVVLCSLLGCGSDREAKEGSTRGSATQESAPISCDGMPAGWVLATAITPDAVPPCKSGSSGMCPAGYRYVSGTGWCRPNVKAPEG